MFNNKFRIFVFALLACAIAHAQVGGGIHAGIANCTRFYTVSSSTTGAGSALSSSANLATLWGFTLTCAITTTQVTYKLSTADNTAHTYDLGILDPSGNLIVHTGALAGTTFSPATACCVTQSWTGGGATLQPGKYYIALTSSATSATAALASCNVICPTFATNVTSAVTAGGTLNAGMAIPADSESFGAAIPVLDLH